MTIPNGEGRVGDGFVSVYVGGRRGQPHLAADELLVGKRHDDAVVECQAERFKGQTKIPVKHQDNGAEDVSGGEVFVTNGYRFNVSAGAAPQEIAALRIGAAPGGLEYERA